MILVFAHTHDATVTGLTKEAVGAAHQLAGGKADDVAAVVLGKNTQDLAKQLIAAGAATVYTMEDAALAGYQPDAYVWAGEEVVKVTKATVVLMGQNDTAKDLAPKLAFRLQAGLTMDCVHAALNGEKLEATKPVYGGNALAVYEMETPVKMVTLRAKAFEPLPEDASRRGAIVPLEFKFDLASLRVRVVEVRREQSTGARLEDAPIVVAGGRGLGAAANFKQLEELAAVLGGAVGATRAVCDAGWVPHAMQVGLTGKAIVPNLYIAIGISGASQHMAGLSGARAIVAINKDKGSNIFKEARYGAVGTWEEILPSFIRTVKELRKS